MSLSHRSDPLWLSHCQGRYFLVRDVAEKMDVLGTLQSCGAPNFRQVQGGLIVFGMGQPSLLGFRQVLQKLQKDGHKVSMVTSQVGAGSSNLGQGGAASEALEESGHMMGRAAGDLDQVLPGGHCGQHGWEILGKCLLHCAVSTWEPQDYTFYTPL